MGKKRATKAVTVTVATIGVVGLYLYQPQRIDFLPRPVPDHNPRIDPDSARLFSAGTRVAVVAAHPDDTEFFLGGTLTKLAQSGAKVLLIVCTDGDKGYYPWFLTNADENRRVRRLEQLEAARAYGAEVIFLAKPDGRLHADQELIRQLQFSLKEFDPEYLLAFDPDYPPRVQHSDHLQSGIAAIEALKQLPKVRWLLRYSTHAPNFYLDVTPFWPEKERLLAVHRSQFNGNRLAKIKRMLRSWAHEDGRAIGADLAESIRVEALGILQAG
jgi:LmbE family N-acetylglucosaminyl deacetylase